MRDMAGFIDASGQLPLTNQLFSANTHATDMKGASFDSSQPTDANGMRLTVTASAVPDLAF